MYKTLPYYPAHDCDDLGLGIEDADTPTCKMYFAQLFFSSDVLSRASLRPGKMYLAALYLRVEDVTGSIDFVLLIDNHF